MNKSFCDILSNGIDKVTFIPVSVIYGFLPEDVRDEVSEQVAGTGDFTFGNNNRTLVTCEAFLKAVDDYCYDVEWTHTPDCKDWIEAINTIFSDGDVDYIDMEN